MDPLVTEDYSDQTSEHSWTPQLQASLFNMPGIQPEFSFAIMRMLRIYRFKT